MAATGAGALVLDGDERSALAVTRSLGRRGVAVTVAAPHPASLAGASRYAGRRIVLPDVMATPDALAAALVVHADREPGEVWFPLTDASLAVVDSVRDRLQGVSLPLPSSEALAVAWDKARLLAIATQAGVATPRTWMPENAAEVRALAPDLQFPVVLKPRRSRWRSAGGFITGEVAYVHAAADLAAAWQRLAASMPAPLIQERVPGYGLGVFVLADRGRIVASFAHRRLREKPPSGGVSVLRTSIAVPPELAAAAERLIAALAWHGVGMIEFKVDTRDGRARLMEVNPRFWGSLQLAVDAGVDFPWLTFQLARGEIPAPVRRYRLGVRSRWELGDLDHLLIRLRGRNRRDLPADAPSRLRALLSFLNPFAGRPEIFRLDDPGPARHELGAYVRTLASSPAAGPVEAPASMAGPSRRLRGAVHVHSRYSYDGTASVDELAAFFRRRRFDFICITEHSDGLTAADLARLAAEAEAASSAEFLVIPGIEFSCRRRLHVLGLGVITPIDSDDPLVVADHIRREGGVAVVAHPVAYGADHPEDLALRVDGLEVWNITKDGWLAPGRESVRLWRRWRTLNPGLRGYAALDLHALDSPADLYLVVEAAGLTPAAVLTALRSGTLELRGRFLGLTGDRPPPRAWEHTLAFLSDTYSNLRAARDRLAARRAGNQPGRKGTLS